MNVGSAERISPKLSALASRYLPFANVACCGVGDRRRAVPFAGLSAGIGLSRRVGHGLFAVSSKRRREECLGNAVVLGRL